MSRIQELEQLITRYQNSYYNGEAEISDAEFDNLWDELKRLDPNNALFIKVGQDISGDFPKAKHVITMGSQQKANSKEEIEEWLKQFKPTEAILSQSKLDGCSIDLYYKEGRIQQAITRGDGYVGDLITKNALKMQGCVTTMKTPFTGSVRGEVLMLRKTKDEFYPQMANCRNAASGIMKRKDGNGCEHLVIITYDVKHESILQHFTRETEKLSFLAANGFETVDCTGFTVKVDSAEELTDMMLRMNKNRLELPYDIDGIVFKKNVCDLEDLDSLLPKTQIAYKFPREEVVSTLKDVEWSLSNGTFTPVGIIEPVQLCGTTVQQASLCNIGLIEKAGLKIGCKVCVTKRGEIIPKIEKVFSHEAGEKDIWIPTMCPACGNKLYTNANKTKTSCLNPFCSSIQVGKLNKWVTTLGIKELAPATLNKLLDNKIINGTVTSLYKIDFGKVEQIEGFGQKSAQVIKANIESVKEVYLSDFIAGFNIPSIGAKVAEKALKNSGSSTLEEFLTKKGSDFIGSGIGEEIAAKLARGLRDNAEDMRGTLSFISIKSASEGILDGVSVCFTGSLRTMKRSEAAEKVRQAGGQVKDDVVKGLTYLVTNDPLSGSSKNKKAAAQGTKVITEEEFLALFK